MTDEQKMIVTYCKMLVFTAIVMCIFSVAKAEQQIVIDRYDLAKLQGDPTVLEGSKPTIKPVKEHVCPECPVCPDVPEPEIIVTTKWCDTETEDCDAAK